MQPLKWIGILMLALAALPAAAELGVDWEVASTDHPFAGRSHVGLVEFKGKLYAGGGTTYASRYINNVYHDDLWMSDDGLIWSPIWSNPSTVGYFDYGITQYALLVEFQGYLYYFGRAWLDIVRSADGVHWESVDMWVDAGDDWKVVVLNDRMIGVGSGYYSDDGLSWNGIIEGATGGGVGIGSTVAVHDGAIYAFSNHLDSPQVVRTTDHVNWTELNAGNYYELQVYDDADVRLVSF
ncbi:MAG: hypothetical protein GC168_21080, partial [Candidatus Hydrogenedens sp.]|nr:hypothetical protein [Candidatus Hydrogenedens sp.]